MRIRRYVKLLLLLLLVSSCKKDLVDIDHNYQGEWHTESEMLDSGIEVESFFIIDEGTGVYGESCLLDPVGTGCLVYHSGSAQTTKKQKIMFIGDPSENIRLRIRIDEPPHLNSNGKWECTLMDRVYIRN